MKQFERQVEEGDSRGLWWSGWPVQTVPSVSLPSSSYALGDRTMQWLAAICLVTTTAGAAVQNTWPIATPISVLLYLILAFTMSRSKGKYISRVVAAFVLQAFSLLFIYELGGRLESHFLVFISITALIIYRDWKCLWPCLLVVVYPLVLGLFKETGPLAASPSAYALFAGTVFLQITFSALFARLLEVQLLNDIGHMGELRAAREILTDRLKETEESLETAIKDNQDLAMEMMNRHFAFEGMSVTKTKLEEEKELLQQKADEFKMLSEFDGLTGLYNHRVFRERLGHHFTDSVENGTPLTLLMIDLDRFKQLNDNYGHLAGDMALKAAARTLADLSPDRCVPCRYGGEEFALICPGYTAAQGYELAERIRIGIALIVLDEITITASVGIGRYSDSTPTIDALIDISDQALYQAKMSGRNQTRPSLKEITSEAA